MPDFDLLIRGATPHPFIGIAEGSIVALADGSAAETIEADGLTVLPGVVDAHVHFNEPGRADWEGLATGSAACAVGGTTTFFDMPLNSTPPLCTPDAFDAKLAAANGVSHVDFAFWGGLIPGNIDQLEPLARRGIIGLKAFMSNSGIEDFPKSDPATLRAGMRLAARLGVVVAVHAEIDHPELRHGTSIREYLESRPIATELEAIRIALDLAGETECALHVVHVSCPEGIDVIREAAAQGVNVTCETCPHYFVLTGADVERIGPLAKCAPPVRSGHERLELLKRILSGRVDTIGSDHSPSPMSMKQDPDFFRVWGGIAGCQHLLLLAYDAGIDVESIGRLMGSSPSDRFSVTKGRIEVGADADLVLIDPKGLTHVTEESLLYRHRNSPYVGRTLRGKVVRTYLRGECVAENGQIIGAPSGRLVRRTNAA